MFVCRHLDTDPISLISIAFRFGVFPPFGRCAWKPGDVQPDSRCRIRHCNQCRVKWRRGRACDYRRHDMRPDMRSLQDIPPNWREQLDKGLSSIRLKSNRAIGDATCLINGDIKCPPIRRQSAKPDPNHTGRAQRIAAPAASRPLTRRQRSSR